MQSEIALERFLPFLALSCSFVAAAAAEGSRGSSRTACSRQDNIVIPKIKGGNDAPVCRFSYMVSLRDSNGTHHCGGAVIDPRWVITAAHCVDPKQPNSLTTSPAVAIGPYFLADNEVIEGVQELLGQAFVHPNYNGELENGFDLALIRLPVEVDVRPVNFPMSSYMLHADMKTVALGWGKEGKTPENQALQMVNLYIVDREKCKGQLGYTLQDTMICARSETGDTCRGDSGGPLVVAHTPQSGLENGSASLDLLVGLVSFGEGDCEEATVPGIYTKVAAFYDWINSVMQEQEVTAPSGTTVTPQSGGSSNGLSKNQEKMAPPSEKDDSNTDDKQESPPSTTGSDDSGVDGRNVGDDNEQEDGPDPPPAGQRSQTIPGNNGTAVDASSVQSGDDLNNALLGALWSNNTEQVKSLLESGADPNAMCEKGKMPLHIAAERGSLEATQVLIEAGAELDAQDDNGWTALHRASFEGYLDIVQALVDAGSDMEAKTLFQQTPLERAAAGNHTEAARLLIKSGADIDTRDDRGWSALHIAASQANVDLVKILLVNGATKSSPEGTPSVVKLVPSDSPYKEELTRLLS